MEVAGIKIAKALIAKLPEGQRTDVKDNLWTLSGGICHLCGREMNRSSDVIEADHDIPESEGGATILENLKLAHKVCNATKRASPTIDVRPYLKLIVFIQESSGSGPVRYGECAKLFNIAPANVHMTRRSNSEMEFELPGGRRVVSEVYAQQNRAAKFEHCYLSVPRSAIHNDDECQPRNIKPAQAWAIYNDLQRNPLHEPPACRLDHVAGDEYRLLMFDGQHKTVASWMSGYENIVVKVYINLTKQQATTLVNSIQAKIKKLPLSPFEVAAKLGDEWRNRWTAYEEEVTAEVASEAGFIRWLDSVDRARGLQAFREGRIRQLLDRDDLHLLQLIKRQGNAEGAIPEATFKIKVLQELLHSKALEDQGERGEQKRKKEADNIVKLLNHLYIQVFEAPNGGDVFTVEQGEVQRRIVYQGALKFVSEMLRRIVNNYCTTDERMEFIEADFDDEKWKKISSSVNRLVQHPIWHHNFEATSKTRAVRDALQKNQQVKEKLKDVGLTAGYVLGAEELAGDWYK